jgi:hypothetical protein
MVKTKYDDGISKGEIQKVEELLRWLGTTYPLAGKYEFNFTRGAQGVAFDLTDDPVKGIVNIWWNSGLPWAELVYAVIHEYKHMIQIDTGKDMTERGVMLWAQARTSLYLKETSTA